MTVMKSINSSEASSTVAVIPPRQVQIIQREYDREIYNKRNLAERLLQRLKQFSRVAIRYERLKRNDQAIRYLAGSLNGWLSC